jgi:predicted enzyme related to lactoylglutathione lyase
MTDLLVNIDVDDLGRAVAFYCDALGLRVGRRFGADGIELLGASAPIYLLVKAAGTQPVPESTQVRDYRRHWSPVHLDFVVPDVEAAVARAIAAGATLERPVRTSAWGKLAPLADPFGHGFCLLEFVGRGYDEIAEPAPQSFTQG